jgi:hypothetical protein
MADDYALAYKKITELTTATGVPASGDYNVRWDASTGGPVKIDATSLTDTVGTTATADELNMAADSSANTELVTTTNVLTAAESGATLVFNTATAFVTTLPALAKGVRYKFYAGATEVTGGNHTIACTNNDNTIHGQCTVAGALVAAADEGVINLVADKFLQGDWIEVFCDGVGWYVSGQVVTSGGCTFTT